MKKEWESIFPDKMLYKARSSGNAYASSKDVQERAIDAIKILGTSLNHKYAVLINSMVDSSSYVSSQTTYNTSTIGNTIISTPSTRYNTYSKFVFETYVLYADDESEIPFIRNIYKSINVYELE